MDIIAGEKMFIEINDQTIKNNFIECLKNPENKFNNYYIGISYNTITDILKDKDKKEIINKIEKENYHLYLDERFTKNSLKVDFNINSNAGGIGYFESI
jgi:hypothetical protein